MAVILNLRGGNTGCGSVLPLCDLSDIIIKKVGNVQKCLHGLKID